MELSSSEQFKTLLSQDCGFSTDHPLFTLHTEKADIEQFTDNSDIATVLNTRQPTSRQRNENKQRFIATFDSVDQIIKKESSSVIKEKELFAI